VRRQQLYNILLRAAEISHRTEFIVICSQALYGAVEEEELNIATVINSNDVDFYPVLLVGAATWEELMLELGQDSDFHVEHDIYIEVVPPDLARFPDAWQQRVHTREIGSCVINGTARAVSVTFPEIHDLAVAKVVIGREKDRAFIDEVVMLGLVDRGILEERLKLAPRTAIERIDEALREIEELYQRQSRRRV
jgi:hypothetical protein